MTIAVSGLLLTVSAAALFDYQVSARQEASLERAADHFTLATERAVRQAIADVSAVAGFFAASAVVTPVEFDTFVEQGLANRGELHAMLWVPQGVRLGPSRQGPAGADAATPARVSYVAPKDFLGPLLGADLSRYPRVAESMEAAERHSRTSATVGRDIHRLTDGRIDLVAVAPVFEKRPPNPTGSHVGPPRLAGFVVGVHDIANVLTGIEKSSVTGIEYAIIDQRHGGEPVFRSGGDAGPPGSASVLEPSIFAKPIHREIHLAGISWLVQVAPEYQAVARQHLSAITTALAVGGLLTFLLVSYVVRIQRYARSLHRTNAELEVETAERAQRESELKVMSMAIEQSTAAIMIMFPDGAIEYVNRGFEQITGYARREMLGKTSGLLRSAETSQDLYRDMWRTVSTGGVWSGETLNRRRDGGTYWAAESIWPIRNDEGRVFRLVGIAEDITGRLQDRERLKLLSHAVEQSSSMVVITGPDGTIKYVNRRYEEITGRKAGEVIGQNSRVHQSGHTPQQVYEDMWRVILAGGRWHGELLNKKQCGELYWAAVTITPIKDETGAISHFVAVSEDITDRKRAEARIEQLAHRDSLTGLANRFLFNERLREAFPLASERGGRLAVMAVDLDDFKGVNDTLGHDVGDLLLQEVAARLKASVRATDTVIQAPGQEAALLARIGGDEFFVLLLDAGTLEQIAQVAQRLVTNMHQPMIIEGNEVRTAASVGVAVHPDHSSDPMGLMKCADLALYQAKAQGRNRYCFFEARLQEDINRRRALEDDLRRALTSDVGELTLCYQPQVELAWGRLVGCEALLRWNHPTRGMILPAEFIPVAESSGLILELGTWVIQQACRQIAIWQQQGLDHVTVAVNLSAVQFRRGELVETIHAALAETGISPHQLAVEITETVMLTDTEAALEALRALSALGIHVALDDFGTGYSSLGYLTRFPVDKIKLDRTFVTNLPHDSAKQAITATVVELGHKLGTVVTAEGVETLDQVRALCCHDVDEIQGFFFSEPLSPEALAELARDTDRFKWVRGERLRAATPPRTAGRL